VEMPCALQQCRNQRLIKRNYAKRDGISTCAVGHEVQRTQIETEYRQSCRTTRATNSGSSGHSDLRRQDC
ncbi:MAG: hypothetical protein OEQ53_12095, partial [Saprospiraceae bacterium]|nr:hypothetical protein [Saprospiraceae bacterium]